MEILPKSSKGNSVPLLLVIIAVLIIVILYFIGTDDGKDSLANLISGSENSSVFNNSDSPNSIETKDTMFSDLNSTDSNTPTNDTLMQESDITGSRDDPAFYNEGFLNPTMKDFPDRLTLTLEKFNLDATQASLYYAYSEDTQRGVHYLENQWGHLILDEGPQENCHISSVLRSPDSTKFIISRSCGDAAVISLIGVESPAQGSLQSMTPLIRRELVQDLGWSNFTQIRIVGWIDSDTILVHQRDVDAQFNTLKDFYWSAPLSDLSNRTIITI